MKGLLLFLALFVSVLQGCVSAADFRYQERAIYSFLTTMLMDKDGGIYSNYYTDHPANKNAGVNHDLLSESMGLFMEYLYFYDDKKGFERQVGLLKKKFLSDIGLISWCIRQNGKVEPSDALIDDLRIVRYLLLAGKKWDRKDYIRLAIKVLRAIEKYDVYKGYLTEGASWEKGFIFGYNVTPAKRVNVPYLDLFTIKLASTRLRSFKAFFRGSAGVVAGGILKRGVRMFFYPAKDRYGSKKADPINFLNTVLHLIEVGLCPYELVDYVQKRLLLPKPWNDNAAVCALTSEIFTMLGDRKKSEVALNKMLSNFMIRKGPLAGGIGYLEKGRYHIYAFDNLLAIDAIRMYSLKYK